MFLIKPGHENVVHPALCTTLPIKGLSWDERKDAQSETIFGTEAFLRTKRLQEKISELFFSKKSYYCLDFTK